MQQKVEKWRNCHDDWKSLAAFMLSKNTGRRFKKKKTQNKDSKTTMIVNKKLPKPIPDQEFQNKCQKTLKQYLGLSTLSISTDRKLAKETFNSCSDQSDGDTDGKMKHSDFSGSEDESVDNSVERHIEESSLNRIIHENANEIKEKAIDNNTKSIRSISKEMVVKKLCLDDLTSDGDIVVTGNPNDKSISFLFESQFQRKKMKKNTFFMDSGSEVESLSEDSDDGDSTLDVRNQEEGSFSLENEGRI